MRFIWWNVGLATWLLVTAFALPQTPACTSIASLAAIAVVALALLAGAKPGARHVIAALMVALAFVALLLPDVSAAARLNLGITAALLFALSTVSPHHAATSSTAH